MLLNGKPIGTARLDSSGGGTGVVRLVAVAAAEQGKGHGRVLGNLVDAEARRQGITHLRINAAPSAVGYYEKLGWARELWDPAELAGISSDCIQMTKTFG